MNKTKRELRNEKVFIEIEEIKKETNKTVSNILHNLNDLSFEEVQAIGCFCFCQQLQDTGNINRTYNDKQDRSKNKKSHFLVDYILKNYPRLHNAIEPIIYKAEEEIFILSQKYEDPKRTLNAVNLENFIDKKEYDYIYDRYLRMGLRYTEERFDIEIQPILDKIDKRAKNLNII